jgi:Flp pilus assembly protein TadG
MSHKITHFVESFLKDQRGAAAIEFALLLPVLLTLTIGMFEMAGLISANMKLINSAQLMGNLVAQQTNETNSMTSNFCTGAQDALSPLAATSFKATVASVTHYSTGTAVDWQDTTCGGATLSNAATLAASVIPNVGDSVIIVEASYNYTSPVVFVLSSSYGLTQTTYSRPRNVTNVTHS